MAAASRTRRTAIGGLVTAACFALAVTLSHHAAHRIADMAIESPRRMQSLAEGEPPQIPASVAYSGLAPESEVMRLESLVKQQEKEQMSLEHRVVSDEDKISYSDTTIKSLKAKLARIESKPPPLKGPPGPPGPAGPPGAPSSQSTTLSFPS